MSSLNLEQRKENRIGQRSTRLGCWALVVCWSLSLSHWCFAQRGLIVADPNAWAFAGNSLLVEAPSDTLLAGGRFAMHLASLGMDEPAHTAQAPKSNAAGFGASIDAGSYLDFNWQFTPLTLISQTNIGSTGLLNLSGAVVTNINAMNWKNEGPRPLAGSELNRGSNRIVIRLDRADLPKSTLATPMIASLEEPDRFSSWIVKPDNMPTFAGNGMTVEDPLLLSNSQVLGLGNVQAPAVPLPIDLITDSHIATLAGP